jgi:hypothetical protein
MEAVQVDTTMGNITVNTTANIMANGTNGNLANPVNLAPEIIQTQRFTETTLNNIK